MRDECHWLALCHDKSFHEMRPEKKVFTYLTLRFSTMRSLMYVTPSWCNSSMSSERCFSKDDSRSSLSGLGVDVKW